MTTGRKPHGLRPALLTKNNSLRYGDLARFDLLRFRQGQRHDALLDLRADFASVDRGIELKRAPEILRARFAVEERAFDRRH
jgi:hypothetical protein